MVQYKKFSFFQGNIFKIKNIFIYFNFHIISTQAKELLRSKNNNITTAVKPELVLTDTVGPALGIALRAALRAELAS